jgi:hypothetical protein
VIEIGVDRLLERVGIDGMTKGRLAATPAIYC